MMDYLRASHSLKKKAVAYIRISSTKQIDNESPVTQREKIQQYADANGIEILEWFFDEAKSGKNTDREELQNMLKFALSHRDRIDHVIVYKMNRASRDIDSYVENVKLVLKAKGITVRSATEQFDDTTMGRFTEMLYVLLGQMDNENKREYTLDNMIALALQGYYQHPPVVGYDSCKVPNDIGKPRPSIKPNAMAPKVKDVLERFGWGDITKAELTRYGEEIGLRSRYGKVMGENSINRMLQHPIYAGYIKDRFTDYELVESNKFEALISKEVFERNQSLLYAHKNSRKGEIHTKKNELYVLKGCLMCIGCSNRMYASAPRTGSGGHSPRYHCTKGCKLPSIKADLIHDEFRDLLKRIKPSQGTLRLFREVLRKEANNQLGQLNTDVQRLRNELGDISRQRLEAIQKFTVGNLTLEEKNDFIDSLDIQKLDVDSRLSDLERQQAIREADIDHATNFMEEVDRQWDQADFDLKVRFQKMIFPSGLVYDSKDHKFGTNNLSPMYAVYKIQKTSENASEASMNVHLVDLARQLTNPMWELRAKRLEHAIDTAALREPSPVAPRVTKTVRRLDSSEIADVVARYEGGATLREIAAAFEVERRTVMRILKRQGVQARSRRAMSDDGARGVVVLYESGRALAAIADRLHLGTSTVRRILVSQGVTLRAKGRHPQAMWVDQSRPETERQDLSSRQG